MKNPIPAFLMIASLAGLPCPATAEPSPASAGAPHRETDPAVKGKEVAAEFIEYEKESSKPKEQRASDETQKERFESIYSRLQVMSAGQLKIFSDEMFAAEWRQPSMPDNWMRNILRRIIKERPEDVLEVCESLPAGAKDTRSDVIPLALKIVAQQDPVKADSWLEGARQRNPDVFAKKQVAEALVSAVAPQDPKLACEFSLKYKVQPMMIAQYLMGHCETTERRNVALAELRNHAAKMKGDYWRKEVISYGLAAAGSDLANDGFQAASAWADQAGLTEEERKFFNSEIMYSMTPGEEGKWLNWFIEKLPGDEGKKGVALMMKEWTKNDYKAAGNWLNTAPPGEMRNEAVRTYSLELAAYEPEAASGWAVTLPEGKTRDQTLHCIYYSWLKKGEDAEPAAEAFAAQYKIQKHAEGEVHDH